MLNTLVELEMMSEDEIKTKWDVPSKYVKRIFKKLLLAELLDEEKESKEPEQLELAPGEEPKVKRTRRTKEQIEADKGQD